ncbi:coiled-coil domain-containing protein 188 isoform X5 [Sminthopsis crassicaudata]
MNQELRGRLEDIMEPREIRQDFIPVCPNHQRQLQILAWDKECPQMMDDPRTVQVLKQKICPREDPFTEKSQKELQQMRLSFERKKTSITEQPGLLFLLAQVWDGMSEVHMSLTDQAEGLLNLKKDIRTVLDEVEDIRMEILRDKAQGQNVTRRGLAMPEKKPPEPPPCIKEEDNCWTSARRWLGSCFPVFKRLLNEKKICLLLLGSTGQKQEHQLEVKRKSWTIFSKAGLCLFIFSVLFYMYIVNPSPYECLLPPIIGQRTVWRIRTWFNPFLRVEVDDFLPF